MNMIEEMVDYSRQRELNINNIQNGSHIIVGVGGIGYWLALQLAMLGANELWLIDGDRVEASNLNRLPVPLRMSGEFKVKTLKAQLRLLRPTIKVTVLPVHITEDTMDLIRTSRGRVWDCTDDARIQRILSKFCRTNTHMSYVKAGYERWNIGLYSKMEDTWLQDDYTPGYTTSSANVLTSMMAAGMAIIYAGLSHNSGDVHIDLAKLALEGNVTREATDE